MQAVNTTKTIENQSVGAMTLSRVDGSCCGCRCYNETACFPIGCQATCLVSPRSFGALIGRNFHRTKITHKDLHGGTHESRHGT